MTTAKSSRLHHFARGRISRRSSGWFRWEICDSLGGILTLPTLACSGMEKSKGKAQELAAKAARKYNAQYVAPDVHRPERSEIVPSCSRREK